MHKNSDIYKFIQMKVLEELPASTKIVDIFSETRFSVKIKYQQNYEKHTRLCFYKIDFCGECDFEHLILHRKHGPNIIFDDGSLCFGERPDGCMWYLPNDGGKKWDDHYMIDLTSKTEEVYWNK